MTGCLRPTPAGNLPILAGIQRASSRRSHTVSITSCHGAWTSAPLNAHLSTRWEWMTSHIETTICTPAQQLTSSSDHNNTSANPLLADHWLNAERLQNTTRLRTTARWTASEFAMDSECRSQLPQDSTFFFRTRIRSQKFVNNRTRIRSHFSILAVTVNFGWIDRSRSLNRSRIFEFEKFPDPDLDPDLKILEQERSRSLKRWLWWSWMTR